MSGKQKCKVLRQIRKEIADTNGIPFVTADCKFERVCRGTCPKCEGEIRYLEKKLKERQSLGYSIKVAGITTLDVISKTTRSVIDRVKYVIDDIVYPLQGEEESWDEEQGWRYPDEVENDEY